MTDLHAALVALLSSPVDWTEAGRNTLVKALESTSVAPASVDSAELNAILGELADFVASKWKDVANSIPAPEVVSGCSEVEWDRVGAGVDLGELGLRSRVFGTVWTASIGHSAFRRSQDAERLWARLVDDESGAVLDELGMCLVDGVWSARGYVPPAARKVATRVDLTTDPALPARPRDKRVRVLVEQQWFRMLHFERLGSIESSSAIWREVYRQRLCIDLPRWAGEWSRPFLAERHVRPTDLASGRPRLVSPDPADSAPSAT